jgi:hypothetical protein
VVGEVTKRIPQAQFLLHPVEKLFHKKRNHQKLNQYSQRIKTYGKKTQMRKHVS